MISFSQFKARFSSRATAMMFLAVSFTMVAQTGSGTTPADPATVPFLTAKVLVGLPEIAPNVEGDLAFSAANITFTAAHGSERIAKRRILSVTGGDERVETGGTTGKIARMAIPYGGGLALGAVTHKKVGLLTVEYLDAAGQYHGAVFEMKTQDVDPAIAAIAFHPTALEAPAALGASACVGWMVQPDAVRVEVIDANVVSAFPAEDRAMLYERLVQRLSDEKSVTAVYRAGDLSKEAQCAEFVVTVRADVFTKGDQAVRASVGPLGHFVGTTKLSFHLTVATRDGNTILDEELKKSEGSDTDSLNITKVISKSVVKNLKKSRTVMLKSEAM